MSPEERQSILDNISSEDIDKIEQLKKQSVTVEVEDLLLTEFALKFGWNAYKEARDDRISFKEMMILITASRKLDSLELFRNSQAAFIGAASANSSKPSQTFNAATSNIVKDIR